MNFLLQSMHFFFNFYYDKTKKLKIDFVIIICDRIWEKDLITQIMILLYRRFSATTPKNNSRDKTFVFVSEVSPTLCLHSR